MYTGPRPKSKKTINLRKMRNQQRRQHPQFRVIYIDAHELVCMSEATIRQLVTDFIEEFASEMRLRHFWTGKRFRLESFQEFDVDFNRYRITIQEQFDPPRSHHGNKPAQAHQDPVLPAL